MDAVTLDGLLGELAPSLVGRHLSRPRLVGAGAIVLETSGARDSRLWLDAERGTAGIYRLTREESKRLETLGGGEPSGRARQLLLHLRKHVDGARVDSIRRIAGERAIMIETGDGLLVLRLSGAAPALSFVVDGSLLGSVGDGPDAWPPPAPAPEREWDRIEPALVEAKAAEGGLRVRAILEACPGLGPALARELDGSALSFQALQRRLASPRPTVLAAAAPEAWHDSDLAASPAVLLPIPAARPPLVALHPTTWTEAAALFLVARRRGAAFERRRRQALDEVRRRIRKHAQLETHLERDRERFPDEGELRRDGEALLASGQALVPGATEVVLDDPYRPDATRRIAVDPRLTAPANADRVFAKARRIERARRQVEERLGETRSELVAERAREQALLEVRDLSALPAGDSEGGGGRARDGERGGPRHYLTSRGLSLLVGRGARENHELTFSMARPDDFWLHARDVPGAHVVLRDNEGRAAADDLREAAEVAAFFSDARRETAVDVHVARRKHLRPGRGGPGRVQIGHSETLRVAPRDPEGRLRRR
jgi:predicted ribosome quality control (RQC) complex YloA/Tae2 family protein